MKFQKPHNYSLSPSNRNGPKRREKKQTTEITTMLYKANSTHKFSWRLISFIKHQKPILILNMHYIKLLSIIFYYDATILSAPHIKQHQMVGLRVDTELEGIWKEVATSCLRYYPAICIEAPQSEE